MAVQLNRNIHILDNGNRKTHSKASEEYIQVRFIYDNNYKWEGWLPVEYRRTGVSISDTNALHEYLNLVYEQLNPTNLEDWLANQEEFQATKSKAAVTKGFYDELVKGGWKCVECAFPKNPNWARRIQDLKEFGYTLATDTNRPCPKCGANKTHILLLPITRGGIAGNGYETIPPALKKRILAVLGGVDVYENRKNPHSLPDHKFSEIRWDNAVKAINPVDMSEEEICNKFQLLSNQRNQQKREVCRNCFQTGQRGVTYGIPYFYEGTNVWDNKIPAIGKQAERGCVGCAWYDIAEWRKKLLQALREKGLL